MEREISSYLVEKVKVKRGFYIIYASKHDTLYKIVSERIKGDSGACDKIKVGKEYDFALESRRESAPTINGVKINPMGFTGCYYYSEAVSICLEPENGIWDLHKAKNIRGLYYCN